MTDRLQIRRDTLAEWVRCNPVLADGEPGFALPHGPLKIGDGVTPWLGLPSIGAGGGGEGSRWWTGSGPPEPNCGPLASSWDLYLDLDTGDIYTCGGVTGPNGPVALWPPAPSGPPPQFTPDRAVTTLVP